MKTKIFSIISRLTTLILIIGLASECSLSKCPCTIEVTKLIAKTYSLSLPLFGDDEGMTNIVQENAALFQEDGEAIKCLRQLSRTYTTKAIELYSPSDYDYAYGRVLEMGGTGEMATKAASNLSAGVVDYFAMGQELEWLSNVLPSAARGNWYLFNSTGTDTRNAIRMVVPIINSMVLDYESFLQAIQLGKETMAAYQPSVEYEIMTVAAISCK